MPRNAAIEHPEHRKPPPIPPRPWENPPPEPKIYDPDEMISNYSELYYEDDKRVTIGFPKPSLYLKMSDEDRKKVDQNVSKGMNKTMKWKSKRERSRKKQEFAIFQKANLMKYKQVIGTSMKGQQHMKEKQGKGLCTYKQPKRSAYKIQNSHNTKCSAHEWWYGGGANALLIDYPKLMDNMLLDVYKNNKLVYQDKADRSLNDLLTKRYNPKTKYSIDAVRIFNDLNLLANMAKH